MKLFSTTQNRHWQKKSASADCINTRMSREARQPLFDIIF